MKDLYIDTNVFIRYFLGDIPIQFAIAKETFSKIENKEIKGFISVLVLNELIWVLENYYELKREAFIPKIEKILLLETIKVVEIKKESVLEILSKMKRKKIDFTDIYLTYITDLKSILSFDKDFIKI